MSYPIKSGVFGGSGGTIFNDYTRERSIVGVKSVHIHHGNQVDMIEITYNLSDGRTWNGQHGGSGGSSHSSFSLAEGDYISKIDGKTNDVIVDQLTFTVTTKTGSTVVHGPYGKTAKKAFSVQGKIVAFFGNSGNLLDGVGVYYHPK